MISLVYGAVVCLGQLTSSEWLRIHLSVTWELDFSGIATLDLELRVQFS